MKLLYSRVPLFMMLTLMTVPPAAAIPTMIRLGYNNCAACHIAPQGGGLLNLYGRSIDQAQSFIGGEYQPWQNQLIRELNWSGRITQDFRMVMQQQGVSTTDKAGTQALRSRFFYRNSTELGGGWRLTAAVTGEMRAHCVPDSLTLRPSIRVRYS
jgi:hypothetical protein